MQLCTRFCDFIIQFYRDSWSTNNNIPRFNFLHNKRLIVIIFIYMDGFQERMDWLLTLSQLFWVAPLLFFFLAIFCDFENFEKEKNPRKNQKSWGHLNRTRLILRLVSPTCHTFPEHYRHEPEARIQPGRKGSTFVSIIRSLFGFPGFLGFSVGFFFDFEHLTQTDLLV